MEQNLQRRLAGLKDKLPDIQKTLDTVQFLKPGGTSMPRQDLGPQREFDGRIADRWCRRSLIQ